MENVPTAQRGWPQHRHAASGATVPAYAKHGTVCAKRTDAGFVTNMQSHAAMAAHQGLWHQPLPCLHALPQQTTYAGLGPTLLEEKENRTPLAAQTPLSCPTLSPANSLAYAYGSDESVDTTRPRRTITVQRPPSLQPAPPEAAPCSPCLSSSRGHIAPPPHPQLLTTPVGLIPAVSCAGTPPLPTTGGTTHIQQGTHMCCWLITRLVCLLRCCLRLLASC